MRPYCASIQPALAFASERIPVGCNANRLTVLHHHQLVQDLARRDSWKSRNERQCGTDTKEIRHSRVHPGPVQAVHLQHPMQVPVVQASIGLAWTL